MFRRVGVQPEQINRVLSVPRKETKMNTSNELPPMLQLLRAKRFFELFSREIRTKTRVTNFHVTGDNLLKNIQNIQKYSLLLEQFTKFPHWVNCKHYRSN